VATWAVPNGPIGAIITHTTRAHCSASKASSTQASALRPRAVIRGFKEGKTRCKADIRLRIAVG